MCFKAVALTAYKPHDRKIYFCSTLRNTIYLKDEKYTSVLSLNMLSTLSNGIMPSFTFAIP